VLNKTPGVRKAPGVLRILKPKQLKPGWYSNPATPNQTQWWNGTNWENHYHPIPPPNPHAKRNRLIANLLFGLAFMIVGVFAWENIASNWLQQQRQQQLHQEFETLLNNPVIAANYHSLATTTTNPTSQPRTLPTTPAPGEIAGQILIPSIGVDQIVLAGTSRSILKNGPGIWEWGVAPGAPGNATLSGHRTTYGAPFRRLDELQIGDQIVWKAPNQPDAVFEVRGTTLVAPTQVGVTEPTGGVRLTLTTCDPVGSAARRLVVQAELVEGAYLSEALPTNDWFFQLGN